MLGLYKSDFALEEFQPAEKSSITESNLEKQDHLDATPRCIYDVNFTTVMLAKLNFEKFMH